MTNPSLYAISNPKPGPRPRLCAPSRGHSAFSLIDCLITLLITLVITLLITGVEKCSNCKGFPVA